jgi:uncharacterized protein (TIGR02145 family)
MAENLKVTHYRNGDPIPQVTDSSAWEYLTTGAYCKYNNNEDTAATYDRLYNWYAVGDSREIAPEGWHIPTIDEWEILRDYLCSCTPGCDYGLHVGGKMKEKGTIHWKSPNTGATNESGFTAIPGGYRYNNFRVFGSGDTCIRIESLDAVYYALSYLDDILDIDDMRKFAGCSVRCIKD